MAAILAAILLGERPLPMNWVGIGLIAVGGWLAAWKP
jgi:drug/metabolite transporter (DMT)-like permease